MANSSIRPTKWFADLASRYKITFADFASDFSQEVIWLSRVTRTYSAETHRTSKRRQFADYVDTALTATYRADVQPEVTTMMIDYQPSQDLLRPAAA